MSHRVLIIDDEIAQCKLLQLMLGRNGFEADAAGSSLEAFAYLEQHPVDLILLDVMLADQSGLEVLEQLYALPQLSTIPVIFVTGRSDIHDADHEWPANVVGVLVKPFMSDVLMEFVHQALKVPGG